MRKLLLALTATLLLTSTNNTGVAQAWPDWLEGEPSLLTSSDAQIGVYIWEYDDRINIRVLGDRRYTITAALNYGEIQIQKRIGLDVNDRIRFSEDKGEVVIRIAGSDVPEGVTIHAEGNRVSIRCTVDGGDDCPTEEIFLGSDSRQPEGFPLSFSRKGD